MKQKIVLEMQISCSNCPKKALMIAAKANGVESIEIAGRLRNRMVVTGDRIDIVKLTAKLRKKVGSTDILCVTLLNERDRD